MALAEISIAAATAVVDYDLLSNSPYKQSGRPRRIRSVGLAGSAAAGDTLVSILVGNNEVGRLYNKATGFPTRDHLFPVGAPVPPNQEVTVRVVDAPATNAINLAIDFQD
jgi:hypothetical protein